MAEAQWHCYFDRTQDGPLAESVLTRRFGERAVPLHALVWSEAWKGDDWRPAREVDAFCRAGTGPALKAPSAVPAPPMAVAAPRAARKPGPVRPAGPIPSIPAGAPLRPGPRPPVPLAGGRVGAPPVPVTPARTRGAAMAGMILPPPGPWARFWARMVDFVVGGNVLLALFAAPFAPDLARDSYLAQAFVGPLVWMIVETLLINQFGTTPGKWAFDIQVQTPGGELPGFWAALRRGVAVFLRGLGAGVPPFAVVGMVVAYQQLTQDGQTGWDRDTGLTVVCRGSGWLGWTVLTLALCVAVWVLVTTWQP